MRNAKLFLGLALVLGSFALGAQPAQAQWNAFGVCPTASDTPDLFDPNAFQGVPKCAKLCRTSADFCRKLVKSGVSCDSLSLSALYDFENKTECDQLEDPNDRKDCHAGIKQGRSDLKTALGGYLADTLDSCEAFFGDCVAACNEAL